MTTTVQEGLNITDERKKEILELLNTMRRHTDTKSEMFQEIMAHGGISDVEKAYMIFHYSSRVDIKGLADAITRFLQENGAPPTDAIAICEIVKAQALISMVIPSNMEMSALPSELGDILRKMRRGMS